MDIQSDPSSTPAPPLAQTPTQEVPLVTPGANPFKFKKGKMTLVIGVTLLLFLALIAAGYYFLVYQKNLSNTEDANAAIFIPEEDEIDYVNNTYGFKMIVKRLWNVNEFGTKVEFKTQNNGQISFEAFDDSEFASITEIDERFCQSFETGFREGIADSEIAQQFSFTLLEQNGLKGCEADGEVLGFKQKYNVFYNPANNNVYTIFYTSSDPATEDELVKALSTFRLAD